MKINFPEAEAARITASVSSRGADAVVAGAGLMRPPRAVADMFSTLGRFPSTTLAIAPSLSRV